MKKLDSWLGGKVFRGGLRMGEHEKLNGIYEIEIRQSRIERLKDKISGFVYMIKSYLKLVPCGYCGKANDPEMMCYKCWKKIRERRGRG